MECLPDDVIGVIKEFIPIKVIYVVNKSYFYNNYPDIIKDYSIKDAIFKKYVKKIVNSDCSLQFNMLLKNNIYKWNRSNKWVYDFSTYPNYAIFIKQCCIDNNSSKCKYLIDKYINDSCYKKNKYKKIRIKNTKWSN